MKSKSLLFLGLALLAAALLLAVVALTADAAGTAPATTVGGTVDVVQPTAKTPWWYVAVRLDTGRIATARVWSLRRAGPFRVGQRVTVTGVPDAYGDILGARIR